METDWLKLVPRILIAFPFGVCVIVSFSFAIKYFNSFFLMDYQGNSKERFKDNLLGNIYMALGIVCILPAFFSFQYGYLDWDILSVSFCLGVIILPVGILGGYWRSRLMNKLWGGFTPLVQEQYGNIQPQQTNQHKIDPSKIKIPKRTIFTAALLALVIFFGMFYLLSIIGWNGNVLSGLIFRFFVSGLLAFAIFMTIGSVSLSRRIQRMKDGETFDNDNDF